MDLVRQLRKAKGWSQEQLAEAAQIGKATVQRIENGRVVPTRETALSLAAALDADARSIRLAAGLSGQVSRIMEITFERDATRAERSDEPPIGSRPFKPKPTPSRNVSTRRRKKPWMPWNL
jgi:transcriptional regulator with XRE-family HTH domain